MRSPARTSSSSPSPTSTRAAWKQAKAIAPGIKTYLDYRYLLDDKSIDAVLIATPQHLHCEHFVASLDAGKHVYQEKTMAFTVDHAKRMRAAYQKARRRVVQIGHKSLFVGRMHGRAADSWPTSRWARSPRIHSDVPQHAARQAAVVAPGHPDMTPENILWK